MWRHFRGWIPLVGMGLVMAGAFFGTWACETATERRVIRIARTEHRGRIAWAVEKTLFVLDISDLPATEKAKRFDLAEEPRRLLWSTDGKRIYFLTEDLTFEEEDSADRIVLFDLHTGYKRTLFDLGTAKLASRQIYTPTFRMRETGDAERATDRVVFQLEEGDDWYGVDTRSGEVKWETVRPDTAREPGYCSHAKHGVRRGEGGGMVVYDEEGETRVTKEDITGEPAWWEER